MDPVVFGPVPLPHAVAARSGLSAIGAARERTPWGRPARRPAAVVLVAQLLLGGAVASLTGCSDLQDPALASRPAVRPRAGRDSTPDSEVVLKRSAEQLRSAVDAVRAGLPVRMVNRFLDARQKCEPTATDIWPAQWILDQRIYLTVIDTRPAGRSVADRFAAQGWRVSRQTGATDADQYTFQRRGYEITLAAARDDGSLNLQTNGPCINADGTVSTVTPS
jgi:hypothetical protein